MEILIRDIIKRATGILQEKHVTDAEIDSWLLAEHVFGITRHNFYMNPNMTADKELTDRYFELVQKRADKIPLQYITGTQEFMGYTFKVNEHVLIPRQDTELLVEKAVECISTFDREIQVLDMCTGSGCIAISINKMCSNVHVLAVDVSEKALEVARENNKINHANVEFIRSDLFESVSGKFDVLVSNPPYIKTEEIGKLMEEVKEHEPIMALDGAGDGLKYYQLISEQSEKYLNRNGKILFEIGYDQGKSVPEILRKNNFKNISVLKDLSGNDRVVIAGKE